MEMKNEIKLEKSDVWKAMYRNVYIEIKRWDGYRSPEMRSPWKEHWTYYIYLYERHCKDFDAIWLADKLTSWSESGPKHITNDYYDSPLANIEMHGGITYYSKHGQVEGHRTVQIGCDFQHLHDEGQTYYVEDILREARITADECVETFYKEESK